MNLDVLRRGILPLLLVIEVLCFAPVCGVSWASPAEFFESGLSFGSDLVVRAAPLALLACGMTLVLATAGVDLSIASAAALVAGVMSLFDPGTAFWWTAVPVGIGLGLLLGAFNGWLIAGLDVPPIIATLGTLFFYRGLAEIVLGDRENAPFGDVPGYGWLGSVSGALVLAAIVLIGGGLYFTFSRWRRELLMLGGNRVAARYAGIPVFWRLFQVYALMGLLAGLAAVCFTARDGSVKASSWTGYELQVIVAVILGGTRVSGGNASIFGSTLGVLLIVVLDEGLHGLSFTYPRSLPFDVSHLQYLLMGLLLVGGVWLNTHFGAKRAALNR